MMISRHFEQRKKDDKELDALVERIEARKTERAKQIKVRQERDRAIQERNARERAEREAEIARKAAEAEEKKRVQLESVKNYSQSVFVEKFYGLKNLI